MIKIEVFASPGCRRCLGTVRSVEKIAQEIGAEGVEWRRVDVLEEIDYAVELGVLATPAIAIDGALVFTASPSEKALREAIASHLAANLGEQLSVGREQ